MAPVRAVYEEGRLRPLEPLHLREGEEVGIIVMADDDPIRRALSPLLAPVGPESPEEDDSSDEELLVELNSLLANAPPLSDVIIEERRAGP